MSADYTRSEVTTTRVEYRVPAKPEGQGYSYWGELRRAIYAIEKELGDRAVYEDVVRIEVCDDEIALSFRKDQP